MKVSRDDLINQIKILTKQNEHLQQQVGFVKATNGELNQSMNLVLPYHGKYHEAELRWNIDTGDAKITVGKMTTEDLFRAQFEAELRMADYYRHLK